MIPAEFSYVAPTSLQEATRLLNENAGSKVLAGGMSLIPAMKHRLAMPPLLVDIARIRGLGDVDEHRGRVRIGTRATHDEVGSSVQLRGFPIFAETAEQIGDLQVRNRGTFGGSLTHADPAADWPAVFLALGGEATVVGPKGTRQIRAGDFFVGMLRSAVGPAEVLSEVSMSVVRERAGAAYCKLRQPASGFAIVGVAASVVLDARDRIQTVALAATGVNAVPFRIASVEARLTGLSPDADELRALCANADEADPLEDMHASAEYRRHLLGVYAVRALERALARARA
jgi:aerobic carbon-monoxide dehydrogenase medium subunit